MMLTIFSPQLQDKIWEWSENEARKLAVSTEVC